ncbi:MAG: tetratricopeptide repeat protein [Candidatus Ratteibacteria bacterium]|jgi:tetratricopeptide (TPR) repeat protein
MKNILLFGWKKAKSLLGRSLPKTRKKKLIIIAGIGIIAIVFAKVFMRGYIEQQFFPDKVSYLMAEATFQENKGNYKKAIAIYRKVAKKYPEKAGEAMHSMIYAKWMMNPGQVNEDFIKTCEEVLKAYPSNMRASFAVGFLVSSWQKTNSLVPSCKKFVGENPDSVASAAVMEKVIKNLNTSENYNDLRELCQWILEKYPEAKAASSSLDGLTAYFLKDKRYGETISLCQDIIAKYPKSPVARIARKRTADVFYAEGKTSEAIPAYENFLSEYPEDPELVQIMANLAELYRKKGDNGKAIAYCWKVLEKNPQGDVSGQTIKEIKNIGDSYFRAGNYREAMKTYQEIIYTGLIGNIENDFKKEVLGFGESLDTLGKEVLRQKADFWKTYLALSLDEDNISTYERVNKAIPAGLEKTISGSYLAIDALSKGSIEKAYQYALSSCESYKKSYPSDPRTSKMEETVTALLQQDATFGKELSQYEEALKNPLNEEETAAVYYDLARSYFKSLEIGSALKVFAKITSEFPKTKVAPQAQFGIAKIYDQYMENQSLARSAYQKLIDQYPNHPLAAIALERVVEK